jgi:hypothetical protein
VIDEWPSSYPSPLEDFLPQLTHAEMNYNIWTAMPLRPLEYLSIKSFYAEDLDFRETLFVYLKDHGSTLRTLIFYRYSHNGWMKMARLIKELANSAPFLTRLCFRSERNKVSLQLVSFLSLQGIYCYIVLHQVYPCYVPGKPCKPLIDSSVDEILEALEGLPYLTQLRLGTQTLNKNSISETLRLSNDSGYALISRFFSSLPPLQRLSFSINYHQDEETVWDSRLRLDRFEKAENVLWVARDRTVARDGDVVLSSHPTDIEWPLNEEWDHSALPKGEEWPRPPEGHRLTRSRNLDSNSDSDIISDGYDLEDPGSDEQSDMEGPPGSEGDNEDDAPLTANDDESLIESGLEGEGYQSTRNDLESMLQDGPEEKVNLEWFYKDTLQSGSGTMLQNVPVPPSAEMEHGGPGIDWNDWLNLSDDEDMN